MRKLLKIAVLTLLLVLFIEVIGRQFLEGNTRFDFKESKKSESSVLFVFFPGILADGATQSQELVETVHEHGDVLQVSYDGKRFESKRIERDVVDWIIISMRERPVTDIVFVGASMGGLMSYDTLKLLEKSGLDVKFHIIPMDAPTKRSDLQSPLDKVSLASLVVWAGPITNLFSGLYSKLTFVEPKEENIEDGVDHNKLSAAVEEAKSFPLSWQMDQIRYILGHGKLGEIEAQVIYVRSTRDDDTVRPCAFDAWNDAAGGNAIRIEVDSTHVGFNERPATWQAAFEDDIIPALSLP